MLKTSQPFIFFSLAWLMALGSQGMTTSSKCVAAAQEILSQPSRQSRALDSINQELALFEKSRGRQRMESLQDLSMQIEAAVKSLPQDFERLDQDENFLALLKKILFASDNQINGAELLALQKDPSYLAAIKTALHFRWLQKSVFEFSQSTLRLISGQESKWLHLGSAENTGEFFKYLYWDLLHRPLSVVSPFPLPANRAPTAPIFRKLWVDNHFVPSSIEWALLKKFHAVEIFNDQKAFQLRNPTIKGIRRWIGHAADFAKYLSAAALAIHAHQMTRGGLKTVDQFLADPQSLRGNSVYLLMDTVPLPHLAIYINNRIYTYGQTHITVRDPISYFKERQIQAILKERGMLATEEVAEKNQESADRSSGAVGAGVGKVFQWTGLDKLPQSMEVVTLKLSSEELDRLNRELETHRAKRYENYTMVNDCATMLLRALSENTWMSSMRLIDASPSQIMMALSAKKAAGETRIGDIFQITIEEHDQPYKHLARNLWINAMESKLFINFFWINQSHRLILEMKTGNELQSRDQATEDVIQREWEKDALAELKADLQIALFEDQVSQIAKVKNLAILQQSVEDYFSELIEDLDGASKSGAADLVVREMNRFKVKFLSDKKTELLEKISRFQKK